MSTTIRNVAIAGATGNLGPAILKQLVDSAKFNITVLRRQGSTSTIASGVSVIDVDYSSLDSLQAALVGQDAVVSTLASHAAGGQQTLVDAAVAAGVTRFVPSDFGCDLDNPKTRGLFIFADKVKIQDYLREKAKSTGLSYTFLYSGPFLDWGLKQQFILKTADSKPVLYDGGNTLFSTTTLSSVGDAIVGILSHPEETKNRVTYLDDIKVSQRQLLALAKKAAPGRPWEPEVKSLDEVIAVADARMAQGTVDMEVIIPYLMRSIMDPSYGPAFEKTDNELLGVKGKTEEDVVAMFKALLN